MKQTIHKITCDRCGHLIIEVPARDETDAVVEEATMRVAIGSMIRELHLCSHCIKAVIDPLTSVMRNVPTLSAVPDIPDAPKARRSRAQSPEHRAALSTPRVCHVCGEELPSVHALGSHVMQARRKGTHLDYKETKPIRVAMVTG